MNATMMSFAISLPDWNSLDSVRRAHSDLELAALVFFALLVLFDVLAHFSEGKKRERLLEKIGLCFFAVAVLAELAAYKYGQRNDALSEGVITSLDTKAKQASSDASQAITISGTALSQAKDALGKTSAAEGAMKGAENEAKNARSAASSALTLAQGARTEADSFEKDIVSAKQQAAEAESHLADALQKAADAQAEVNRLKSPRTVNNASAHIPALQAYKGVEYSFVGVFSDAESLALLRQIDSLLQLSGWKRVQANITTGVSFPFEGVSISPMVGTGVLIEVESTKKVESLRATPTPLLPAHIQAGMVLKSELAAAIFPEDDGLKTRAFNVGQGTSTAVKILIGQKP